MISTTLPVAQLCKNQVIALGRQMENNYRQIIFDVSDFTETITSITLVHQRKGDVAPYIVGTGSGTSFTWTITDTDTAYYGYGQGEIRINFDNGLAKSYVFTTMVIKSITGDTVIPTPLQSWYDAMIDYIDEHAASPEQIEAAVEAYLEEHPIPAPVTSVNSKTGAVVLTASDVGALPSSTTIPSKTSQLQNDSGFQNATDVEDAIDAKLSATYKAGGSIAFNQLPVPSATYLGMVYDITDAFTTTSAFIEGAGVDYPAGTDVAIVLNNGNYYYDVLSGFVDLSNYATLTDLNGKQDALTAGTNISINGSTISATDTTYTLSISNNVITLTPSTGTAQTITPSNATTSVAGYMSATDKSHLDDVYADYSSALIALGVI